MTADPEGASPEAHTITREEHEQLVSRATAEAREGVAALRDERDALRDAAQKVCDAFGAGVFVRDVSHDHEAGWAIRTLPHIAALGRLTRLLHALAPEPSSATPTDTTRRAAPDPGDDAGEPGG